MSAPLRVKVEKVDFISNAEALKYLKEYSEIEKSRTGTIPLLLQRVIDYLQRFNKVSLEKATELQEKLSSLGLKEKTIIMIMNTCPKTRDELRPLLVFEEKILETEQLDKIINLLSEYCIE